MKKIIFTFIFFQMSFINFAQDKLEVYFDFDKSELNYSALKKINSWIATGKNYEIVKLYGFCDSKGSNTYNDTLALKRVNAVYNFLITNQIKVTKNIEIRGFGEDFEQSKVQSENRRVTLIYQEKNESVLPKSSEELLKVQVKNSKKGDLIKLDNIYFFNNSAKIVPKSESVFYDLLCVMVDNPKLKVEIQGHICCKKTTDFDSVSTARARAIYNFLIQNKINRNRLSFKGYGVSRPVHPIPEKNATEEDENRRVELLILEN